jgi:hypothetical protein
MTLSVDAIQPLLTRRCGHDIPDTTGYHDGAVRVGDGRLVLLVDFVHGDIWRHGTSAHPLR